MAESTGVISFDYDPYLVSSIVMSFVFIIADESVYISPIISFLWLGDCVW